MKLKLEPVNLLKQYVDELYSSWDRFDLIVQGFDLMTESGSDLVNV